jgi:hypothetical protein
MKQQETTQNEISGDQRPTINIQVNWDNIRGE